MRLCSYKVVPSWAETRNINYNLMDLIHTKKLFILSLLCQWRCFSTVWRKISLFVSVCLSLTHIHTCLVICWPHTDQRAPILRGSFKTFKTRSCKGEEGERAIIYRVILYTYVLFFKSKIHIIFFFNYSFPYNH